jgi:hypothetical protein
VYTKCSLNTFSGSGNGDGEVKDLKIIIIPSIAGIFFIIIVIFCLRKCRAMK